MSATPFTDMMKFAMENKAFSHGKLIKRFRVSNDVWGELWKLGSHTPTPEIDVMDFEGIPTHLDRLLPKGSILKEYEV